MAHNTSVIVPELGCFSIVAKPSVIQNNEIIPPVKTVELDSENTDDDSVFTRYIAEKENITIERAAEEVNKFYNHFFIQKLANNKQSIAFENFGTFSLNDSGNIRFDPVTDFFKDNYGLGHVQIAGDTAKPPPFETVPVVPVPQPAVPPAPVPIIPVESKPVQSPSESAQPVQETKDSSPKTDDGLFDTNNTTRYRENTERRRPVEEKREPPKPLKPSTVSKPLKPALKSQKPPKMKKSDNSNLWVLWVLLIAAGLGVAGYNLYPKINKSLTNKGRPVTIVEKPEAEPAYTGETDENTPNTEVAQTLDEATDKKNALNPAQQEVAKSPSTPSQPVAQSQGNVGSGRWVLIVGSFRIQSNAEKFAKSLQAEGINNEIIVARNQMYWVAVASFDNLAEAARQAEQMKSKREVWVGRR